MKIQKHMETPPNQQLRAARVQHRWSQQELADLVGTTPVNISRWERRVTAPGPHFRQKLCDLFATNAYELGLLQDNSIDEPDKEENNLTVVEQQEVVSEEMLPVPEASLPVWNVPFRRNLIFTGRDDVLLHLYDVLQTEQIVALCGLGGIGKTQTAIEYAYSFRNDYAAVLWIQAQTRETLAADMIALAHFLNLPLKDEIAQEYIIDAVKLWLHDHTDWLLILDNVEDFSILNDFMPTDHTGHLLLTSRAQSTGTLTKHVNLEQMTVEEGMLLLLRRAKLLAPQAVLQDASEDICATAEEIVRLMDGLPLAIDQVGAYVEETGCSLLDYLHLYQHQRIDLLQRRGGTGTDHPLAVAATLSLCIAHMKQTNRVAATLLNFCALLYPDAIPEEIIIKGVEECVSALEPSERDLLALNEALAILRTSSLVQRHPDTKTLTIHRLIQEVLKDAMDENAQHQWAEQTVQAVALVFPDVSDPGNLSCCQRYLPHAQACIALIEEKEIFCPAAVHLLHCVSLYLRERGQFTQAEALAQSARALQEAIAYDMDTSVDLGVLLRQYWYQGQHRYILPRLKKEIAHFEQTLGPESQEVVYRVISLAYTSQALGKYVQAEALFLRVIALWEKDMGEESPYVAFLLGGLACVYLAQGKYAQAEALHQRALAIWEQRPGPAHPFMGQSLDGLAELYLAQGKYDLVEPLLQREREILEQTLGTAYPMFANTFTIQAELYLAQGKYSIVEPLLQRAQVALEQTIGCEHPFFARILKALAELHLIHSSFDQAAALARRAHLLYEQTLGSEHPDTASSINILADISYTQSKWTEAKALYQEALAIFEKTLEPQHRAVVNTRDRLELIKD